MSRTEILDAMREITWSINKRRNNVNLNIKNIQMHVKEFPEMTNLISSFRHRLRANLRTLRILRIRFEKLKQQL
jgi:hypothetical protein